MMYVSDEVREWMEEALDLLEQPHLAVTNQERREKCIPAGYKLLDEQPIAPRPVWLLELLKYVLHESLAIGLSRQDIERLQNYLASQPEQSAMPQPKQPLHKPSADISYTESGADK